jgi:Flp pilus assembly CpaE family ATPase
LISDIYCKKKIRKKINKIKRKREGRRKKEKGEGRREWMLVEKKK